MIPAKKPRNEVNRLASLHEMQILSTAREADLDRITRLAKQILAADISVISLIDDDRQWFKSRAGLEVPETPRDLSFCGHTILEDRYFSVSNAPHDIRFHDNPLVIGSPHIRAYAGVPLTNRQGFRIGTLCVISKDERTFTVEELDSLQDLGHLTEGILEHRVLSTTQAQLIASLEAAERNCLLDPLTGLWNRRAGDQFLSTEFERFRDGVGPLGLVVVDLDRFKTINDSYGHAIGDAVLGRAVEVLVEVVGTQGVAWRFGGEEFVVVLPGVNPTDAARFGEHLLGAVRRKGAVSTMYGTINFTASIGVASATSEMTSGKELFIAADAALRAAKEAGRDRLIIAH